MGENKATSKSSRYPSQSPGFLYGLQPNDTDDQSSQATSVTRSESDPRLIQKPVAKSVSTGFTKKYNMPGRKQSGSSTTVFIINAIEEKQK